MEKIDASGRRLKVEAEQRRRVIQLSWQAMEKFLKSPKVSLKKKAEMASKIIVKDMPDQMQGNITFTQMKKITKGNQSLEVRI